MIGLPKSTEFNRRIPKQKFYENLTVSPTLKRFFVDQIKVIYWRNKIAATTMNLAAGEVVTEIEVFEVKLNESKLDESVLRQIDKEIPYHIIFLLEHGKIPRLRWVLSHQHRKRQDLSLRSHREQVPEVFLCRCVPYPSQKGSH